MWRTFLNCLTKECDLESGRKYMPYKIAINSNSPVRIWDALVMLNKNDYVKRSTSILMNWMRKTSCLHVLDYLKMDLHEYIDHWPNIAQEFFYNTLPTLLYLLSNTIILTKSKILDCFCSLTFRLIRWS